LKAAIDHFKERQIRRGFSMTDPPEGWFGYWVQNESKTLNKTPLTPPHQRDFENYGVRPGVRQAKPGKLERD
jgi:hypothetical protein